MTFQTQGSTRGQEWLTFLFLTIILLPGLTVAFVAAYGFVVWMLQLIYGPPHVVI